MKFLIGSFIVFFALNGVFSQDNFSIVYSTEGWNYGTGGATFQRSVLVLNRDSTYLELNESYLNKKLYRISLYYDLNEDYGHFNVSGDSLILKSKKYPNRIPSKFIIKSNRRIKFYNQDLKIETNKIWKRILKPRLSNLKLKNSS